MGKIRPVVNRSTDQYLHLQSNDLDNTASTYPEEIRADYVWLGAYVRDKCSRRIDVLEAKVKKLGFKTTSTTLSRIIRGKMFNEEGTPILKIREFQRLVTALRNDDRVSSMAGKVNFVETQTWKDIEAYIHVRRAPAAVCKFGLIIGHTGSQKTECLKQYVIRNNHGTCVHMEAPDTATMSKFITDMASRFGVSIWASSQSQRNRITECVNETKTIIIDNVQRLYKPHMGWSQPVFNFLQKLQDDTGCTVILCAIPDFERTLRGGIDRGYFEQFEGRCGGRNGFLVLPEYAPEEDVELIAEAFGLVDAQKHMKDLVAMSRQRGRIRVLFHALQTGKRLAENRRKPFTIDHVCEAIDWPWD